MNYNYKVQELLDHLKNDLYKNQNQTNCLQFFQTSLLHYAISLEVAIGTYSKMYISYEKICQFVPKKFGSRSTIQSILNDGVDKKFFLKKISERDKRVKIYLLSDNFCNEIENWLKLHSDKLISLKDVA